MPITSEHAATWLAHEKLTDAPQDRDPWSVGQSGPSDTRQRQFEVLSRKVDTLVDQMSRLINELQQDRSDRAEGGKVASSQDSDVSDSDAKNLIKKYYASRHGEAIYPDEVADAIGLDLVRAIDLCEQLVREGQLGRAELRSASESE